MVASDLTLVECDRVLIRAEVGGELNAAEAAERRALLAEAAARWVVLALGPDVVDRARRPFPAEPLRTLDALHLASAILAQSVVADVTLLSLDDTLRRAGRALGFRLAPR